MLPFSGVNTSPLTETLTESFCERCGTRYEFQAPTRLNPLRKTRGLFGGLKNYLTSQDALSDAVGDAMRSEEDNLAAAQLDAFHESFNFCIDCRQYTCVNCWNDDAGRCRSCVPIPGTDDLAERLAAAVIDDQPLAGLEPAMAQHDVDRRLGLEAWPTSDLVTDGAIGTNGHTPESWSDVEGFPAEPELEPEPVVAEVEPEPEPVVAEVELEPEPVLAEVEPEPVRWPKSSPSRSRWWPRSSPSRSRSWPKSSPSRSRWWPKSSPSPYGRASASLRGTRTAHTRSSSPSQSSRSRNRSQNRSQSLAEVEPEPVLAEVEPEPVLAEVEPEPVVAEVEPEPVLAEVEPEPVLAEVEPEPVVAEVEPEPEPVVAEVEPEPEPVVAEVEPEPEPVVAEEPRPIRPRLAPISDTILDFPVRPAPEPSALDDERAAAIADSPELAARRAQLDRLGLGDPGQGPIAPDRAQIPYRSRGAPVSQAELARQAALQGSFWEASAREVAGAVGHIGVQSCGQCGLSLSANARFCRRCGTRQAQSA